MPPKLKKSRTPVPVSIVHDQVPRLPDEPTRVSIEKADNGFIVQGDFRDKPKVATTLAEAQKLQKGMLS